MSNSCSDCCGCQAPPGGDAQRQTRTDMTANWVSIFTVAKMDCPAEEGMIRLALNGLEEVRALSFDLANRRLEVVHDGAVESISTILEKLDLGASHLETHAAAAETIANAEQSSLKAAQESATLRLLLAINALMFVVEMTAGLIAQSAGLMADSLDMFADAAVYGLALYAVGHSVARQVQAAHLAGVLQLILALGALTEVVRRSIMGSEPEPLLMMVIAFLALLANTACLLLIAKHREGGAHMKASWIFTANDVLINLGVILAGILVAWTGTHYPDLVIGTIVGLIVLNGARRILAIKAPPQQGLPHKSQPIL